MRKKLTLKKRLASQDPWLRAAFAGLLLPFLFAVTVIGVTRTSQCQGLACLTFYGQGLIVATIAALAASVLVLRSAKVPNAVGVTIIGASFYVACLSYYGTAFSFSSSLSGVAVVAIIACLGALAYGLSAATLARLALRPCVITVMLTALAMLGIAFYIGKNPMLYNQSTVAPAATPDPYAYNDVETYYKPTYLPPGFKAWMKHKDPLEIDTSYRPNVPSTPTGVQSPINIGESGVTMTIARECSQEPYQSCSTVGTMPDGSPIYAFEPYEGEVFTHLGRLEIRVEQSSGFPAPVLTKVLQSMKMSQY